jgi:ribosome biogenesis ATPase
MLRPGRLDKLLYVPLPGKEDKFDILKTILKKIPYDDKNIDLNEISNDSKLDGFSGADLAAFVREAQLHGLKRINKIGLKDNDNENNINNEDNELNSFMLEKEDFNYAINNILPSVSSKDRIKYENLKKKLQESRSHIN